MTRESKFFLSIVVPTFNRRNVLLRTMQGLSALALPGPVELVVVVDGSSDGSAEAARAVSMPFTTKIVEQPNRGAAAARNAGAEATSGMYILFLDDDMIVASDLLSRHEEVLLAGADAVVGHIPVHPDSPPTLLTPGLERWARLRHVRLSKSHGRLALGDLITGQLSVRRQIFNAIGGFDEQFNRLGQFGAEDTDFLYRLLQHGADVRYAPNAVSAQLYVVRPEAYLRQWHQAGRSDAALIRKHPEISDDLLAGHKARGLQGKLLRAVGRLLTISVLKRMAGVVAGPARSERPGLVTRTAFTIVRDLHYWQGHAEASRPQELVVLAFHAVDSIDDGPFSRYAVTAEQLDAHLLALARMGVRWATGHQFLGWLTGERPPGRWVLITFDDAYACLVPNALPVLQRHGATAMVMAVTGRIGDVNAWDIAVGARPQRLLNTDELTRLLAAGWSLGTHTRTHPHLSQLSGGCLDLELAGALADLAALGLPALPVVAYPYGDHDVRVRLAARRAGYAGGFGLDGGRLRRGSSPFAVPRIEVTAGTTPEELVALVGRPPRRLIGTIGREGRLLMRPVLRWSRARRLR